MSRWEKDNLAITKKTRNFRHFHRNWARTPRSHSVFNNNKNNKLHPCWHCQCHYAPRFTAPSLYLFRSGWFIPRCGSRSSFFVWSVIFPSSVLVHRLHQGKWQQIISKIFALNCRNLLSFVERVCLFFLPLNWSHFVWACLRQSSVLGNFKRTCCLTVTPSLTRLCKGT